MNQKQKITAIVPCYNEEKNVQNVLLQLTKADLINEIVVVNDASTDKTLEKILEVRSEKIKIVNLKKNHGKGGALKQGLKTATNEVIFLCDADLNGLAEKHLEKFLDTFVNNSNSIVVGIKDNNHRKITHFFELNLLPTIAGERLVEKKLLEEVLNAEISNNFGIEPFMNFLCKTKGIKIQKFIMEGVTAPSKNHKSGHGTKLHIKEIYDISSRYAKIYLTIFPKTLMEKVKNKLKITKL